MRLGVDISTYFEELQHGAKYFDGNTQVDPVRLLHENGCDIMRIRLWVDPKSPEGEPYLAGNCDLQNFLLMAQFANDNGYSVMLDFHYSDFWCDPGKQCIPKSWQGLNLAQLEAKIGQYTETVLVEARKRNLNIDYIQVGNEITNGILWPVGKLAERDDGSRGNYESLVKLLKSGCAACRKVYPQAKIVLHLERSYDQAIYNEFFTNMVQSEVDFDTIGFSYYPYWHGTFDQFFANAEMCKKFGKQLAVVEVGYAFTLEDYIKNDHGGAHLVVGQNNLESFAFTEEYPISPSGQAHFTADFLARAESCGISAVIWWEPLWIPGEGICWASPAGQKYIREEGKSTRNEWANQCLFDYNGKKLPAFDAFCKGKK